MRTGEQIKALAQDLSEADLAAIIRAKLPPSIDGIVITNTALTIRHYAPAAPTFDIALMCAGLCVTSFVTFSEACAELEKRVRLERKIKATRAEAERLMKEADALEASGK